MRIKLIKIIFLASLVSAVVFSQEIIIIDDQYNPIPDVAIYNVNKTKSSLSNEFGVINISRFTSAEKLFIQHPNYEKKEIIKSEIDNKILLTQKKTLLELVEVKVDKNINNIENVAEKKIFISKNEINELSPESNADLLEKKGGISVQKSQVGGGSPNIRGFEANKVLLVIDGVRLNNAIYRSGHLQNIITIDENMLEGIEVIFGPSSVLYGSDALGGTINMRTKGIYFKSEPVYSGGVLSSYSSSNNGIKNHFNLKFESKKFSTITSFTFKNFGNLKMGSWRPHGFKDWGLVYHYVDENGVNCNPDPSVQVGTGYQQKDFFNKSMYRLSSKWNLTSNIQYSTSSNIPRFDKMNDGDGPCVFDDQGNCVSGENLQFHSYYYGPQERLLSIVTFSGYDLFFDNVEIIGGYQNISESRHKWYMDDYIEYVNNENNYGSQINQFENVKVYSLNSNFRKNKIQFGTETTYNQVSSSSDSNNENIWGFGDTRYPPEGSSLFSSAAYVNVFHRFSHRFQSEAGLRFTYSDVRGEYPDSMNRPIANIEGLSLTAKNKIVSGNVKFLYYPNDQWKLSSVTSRGFHSPNVDDMLKVFKKGNIVTIPNVELMPEKSISQEISVSKKIKNNFNIYGVAFYTSLTNAIVKDSIYWNMNPDTTGEPILANATYYDGELLPTFANQNISDKLNIYGLTAGFKGSLMGYDINGDLNVIKGKNFADDAGPVAHIPPLFGRLEIIRNWQNFKARLLTIYSGHKPSDGFDDAGVDNIDETPLLNNSSENNIWYGSPSWFTLNLYFKYSFSESLNCQLGFENILDAHYKTFGSGISASGRKIICSTHFLF